MLICKYCIKKGIKKEFDTYGFLIMHIRTEHEIEFTMEKNKSFLNCFEEKKNNG